MIACVRIAEPIRRADDRSQPGCPPWYLTPHFWSGESAIMVPHTSDGRVLFAIPWHGHTLVGTTDTPIHGGDLEPVAMEEEIDFILSTAGQYLAKAPTRDDVLSVFAGRASACACRRCEHGSPFARPCYSHRPLRPGKRYGRESGRLTGTWRKIASIRRQRWRSCRSGLHNSRSAHPRIS